MTLKDSNKIICPKRPKEKIKMNLQQLKAKYANNTTTVEAAATQERVRMAGLFGKAAKKTVAVAKTSATAVHGVMPATNRRVDSIASQFNDRINNVEAKQWGQDVKIEMLAQLLGANMPTDEELMEAFVQHQIEEEERQKAELKAKIEERKAERIAEQMADAEPMMQKMFEMFTAMFSKDTAAPAEVADDEIVEVTDEIVEVTDQVEPESQPESESVAPKGRRRIKRGAPLAE
jgi:hypothetical protein